MNEVLDSQFNASSSSKRYTEFARSIFEDTIGLKCGKREGRKTGSHSLVDIHVMGTLIKHSTLLLSSHTLPRLLYLTVSRHGFVIFKIKGR